MLLLKTQLFGGRSNSCPQYQLLLPIDLYSQATCESERPLAPGSDDNELDFSGGESRSEGVEMNTVFQVPELFSSFIYMTTLSLTLPYYNSVPTSFSSPLKVLVWDSNDFKREIV